MMGNQDGGAWGVGKWSMPAKASNSEYPGSYYANNTAPSAPPAAAPSAPPAFYPASGPPKESLYPQIHQPAQPGYPPREQHPAPPAPPAGYASWNSGASFQYVPPSYDSASYSPYTPEYTPYTPPAPPGGYANPHYQSANSMPPPHHQSSMSMPPPHHQNSNLMPPPHLQSSMSIPPHHQNSNSIPPHHQSSMSIPPPHLQSSMSIPPPHHQNSNSIPPHHQSSMSIPPHYRNADPAAPPYYQNAADPAVPYGLPPASGYPPYSSSGSNPYTNSPGPYGAPSVPPNMSPRPGLTHHDSLRLGGSGRDEDRFRAQSMVGPYARTDSGTPGGIPPYFRNDSGSAGGPSPFPRMDSGPVGRPLQYSQSVSLPPPAYHSGPIYGGNAGGGGSNQYVAGAAHPMSPGSPGTDIVPQIPPRHYTTPPTLLHGTLEVSIFQAVRLPNMDGLSQKFSTLTSSLSITQKMPVNSDPYVTVVLANARVARTRVINNDANPKWEEHFSIPVAHPVHDIIFRLRDQDVIGTDHIGDVKIPVERVLDGRVVHDWFDVINPQGKQTRKQAQLLLKVSYIPVEQVQVYMQGVAGGDSHAVPQTYFPCRKGCRLTLYQDTHIYDHTLPTIGLDGGNVYQPRPCWEDLVAAIWNAKHLIYIAGWSVYDKVRLIRDRKRPVPEGGNMTLGELLKLKASQGVRVLLLIWDDKTSHDLTFIKTDGVMNTHDEETKKFFKGTSVRCVLAARYGASKMSWFKQKVVGTLYSHHQKMTIVDSGPNEPRTITSFIGGLDLTGGRWDTPSHCLFGSLDNEHKNDFRNKSWPYAPDSGGPRQPWHDWHCKIEGHAAYDVLTNFEQRWKKATKTHDEELLDIDRHGSLVAPSNKAPLSGDPAVRASDDYDAETWQVQIFRSIDSGSVKGFPLTGEEVTKQFLVWGKSVAIDISIQMAYIKAIRCAQHFIYIENQYFLGSSYNWPDYKTAGADHLIPMELTLKICSKIKANQRFAVYIVIPMWPEGVPESGPVQEILYFQTQTMKMMYRLIGDTLRDCGLSHRKPTDYLNFYCLGNRETKRPGEYEPPKPPASSSNQGKSQRNRRMMIYVHSKGMIVDDEYVISGSANINQRSMDGSRDTEIAMGGYQPHHTWLAKNNRPRGQVYGYRMSLWAEHLGLPLDPLFEEPESLECVRRVNAMSDRNWEQYNAPEVTDMTGHLIRYPLKIEDDGTIRNLPGVETFPDVGGKIMGANQEKLPDDLTA